MSRIRFGDERLHHSDWSHRWSGGPADDAGQQAYQAELREHMAAHQAREDMPRRPGNGPSLPPRNTPPRQPPAHAETPARTADRGQPSAGVPT